MSPDASRIYLDNAATSFPKPPGVVEAVSTYLRDNGAPVGRGGYREAVDVQSAVDRARAAAAALFNAEQRESIIFAFNGTDALNIALHGLLQEGDHVVTTAAEHNSVLRPLAFLQEQRAVTFTIVDVDETGRFAPDDVLAAVTGHTRLIALTHASNVTGAIQPIEPVLQAARERGLRTLIDAAQTAGHLPIDVRELGCDLLACSGHKGLLGPLGTGLLYVRPGVENEIQSLRQGGTGTVSELAEQPASLPDKFEAGNHNAPGLVGLAAALDWLHTRGVAAVRQHELGLLTALRIGLQQIPGVTVFGPADPQQSVGALSVRIGDADPQTTAALLDQHFRIQCRAGLHCAPLVHTAIGTAAAGGTLRFSVGPFNTAEHIDRTIAAVTELAAAFAA